MSRPDGEHDELADDMERSAFVTDTIRVRHLQGDRFQVSIRNHDLVVDQPVDDGGEEKGPTPTELFVAGLASCVAFYGGRFLARHHLPTEGFGVDAEYSIDPHPTRVGQVRLQLRLPDYLPEPYRDRLLAVASHCTVHNSLEQPPVVRIELDSARTEAA